jgi:protein phosphatase 1L
MSVILSSFDLFAFDIVNNTNKMSNANPLIFNLYSLFLQAEANTSPVAYAAVFDGHGGFACAEWLSENFVAYVDKYWEGGAAPTAAINEAFRAADKRILAPKKGFLGAMGERGIGGSKCGATGAVALLYKDKSGKPCILAANAGDARVVLGRKGGKAVQLTIDHVPDSEEERIRIERQNPNPKSPLVRYVGGTWRVGGLLALSRAFGDAFMKGTGQFEGVQAGSDGYSSGFGVIAEPDVNVVELTPEDNWVVISSDGLFANEERGGGGGLTNEEVIQMCDKLSGKSCVEIANILAEKAVEAGTTDDVTLIVLKLST